MSLLYYFLTFLFLLAALSSLRNFTAIARRVNTGVSDSSDEMIYLGNERQSHTGRIRSCVLFKCMVLAESIAAILACVAFFVHQKYGIASWLLIGALFIYYGLKSFYFSKVFSAWDHFGSKNLDE